MIDLGTGGGEVFLSLAADFGTGVGIDHDPAMIQVAQENTPEALRDRVSFRVMRAEALEFADESFDVVLNRHCSVFVEEVVRVLGPDGVFITQQVGRRDADSIGAAFGWGPESHGEDWWQDMSMLAEQFAQKGCETVARGEYNVRSWFRDLESLIFWLKSVPLPERFDIEKHWRQVERFVARHQTPRGIETNEHRELLIVRKLCRPAVAREGVLQDGSHA